MIRQLSPHASGVQKGLPHVFGTMSGTAKALRLPGNRVGIVWASAGTDGILLLLAITSG